MPPSCRCCCYPASLRKCQCRQVYVKLLACAPACATSHGSVSVRVGGRGMVVGGYALVHLPLQVNCVVSAWIGRKKQRGGGLRACMRAWWQERSVCERAHAWNEPVKQGSHQTLKSWAMTTSTADAHAHTRTHTCTLSFFPFLHTYLGQVVQVSFSASFVLCLPNTRVDTLSFFFFYCILLWKKYYMEGKKTSCRTNAGWKQDVQTEGFVFVRFIASVLTALHPAVHFLFAADVISATLLVHWQQPYALGVNWKLGS